LGGTLLCCAVRAAVPCMAEEPKNAVLSANEIAYAPAAATCPAAAWSLHCECCFVLF